MVPTLLPGPPLQIFCPTVLLQVHSKGRLNLRSCKKVTRAEPLLRQELFLDGVLYAVISIISLPCVYLSV
jgi:hypothetical protein